MPVSPGRYSQEDLEELGPVGHITGVFILVLGLLTPALIVDYLSSLPTPEEAIECHDEVVVIPTAGLGHGPMIPARKVNRLICTFADGSKRPFPSG